MRPLLAAAALAVAVVLGVALAALSPAVHAHAQAHAHAHAQAHSQAQARVALADAPGYGITAWQSSLPAASDARAYFDLGLALLHSFEYDDAAAAFRAAQANEPLYVAPYSFEALCSMRFIWLEDYLDEARNVLQRGRAKQAALASPIERALAAAVDELFDVKLAGASREQRMLTYVRDLERMNDAYPDDVELRALHAVAMMGLRVHGYMSLATWQAEHFEEIFAALDGPLRTTNPRHPGLAHYLVHACDDSIHAPLGIFAASRLGEISPLSVHNVHMASHIWFRIGDWERAERANVAAWELSLARGVPDFHSGQWLHYALLMRGKFTSARKLLRAWDGFPGETGIVDAIAKRVLMTAAQVLEEDCLNDKEAAGSADAPPGASLPFDEFLTPLACASATPGLSCLQPDDFLDVSAANAAVQLVNATRAWQRLAVARLRVTTQTEQQALQADALALAIELRATHARLLVEAAVLTGDASLVLNATASILAGYAARLAGAPPGAMPPHVLGATILADAQTCEDALFQLDGPPGLVQPVGDFGLRMTIAPLGVNSTIIASSSSSGDIATLETSSAGARGTAPEALTHRDIDALLLMFAHSNRTMPNRGWALVQYARLLLRASQLDVAGAVIDQLRGIYAAAEVATSPQAAAIKRAIDVLDEERVSLAQARVAFDVSHLPSGISGTTIVLLFVGAFVALLIAVAIGWVLNVRNARTQGGGSGGRYARISLADIEGSMHISSGSMHDDSLGLALGRIESDDDEDVLVRQ